MQWSVFGSTVRGSSHFQSGAPNQDAIQFSVAKEGFPIVLAVSDGHGSDKCFRSDRGSKIAVRVANQVLNEFLFNADKLTPSQVKAIIESRLPIELVKAWRVAVQEDLSLNSFTKEESEKLSSQKSALKADSISESAGLIAYGATLLIVAITSLFIVYLQLGDGDILIQFPGEETGRHALQTDPELIANETTSLCMKNADKLFRTRFQMIQGERPGLILVSTDGYANSFSTPDGFTQVAPDIVNLIRNNGESYVRSELANWLIDASKEGSGDDVTVGIICQTLPLDEQPV